MSGKELIVGVLASIILTSGLIYIGLPLLYPSLMGNTTTTNPPPAEETTTGVILQSKYIEFTDTAYIFDNEIDNFTQMNRTEASITITGNNSRLAASFSAFAIMTLTDTFTGRCSFEISMVISTSSDVQITNRTYHIFFFDEAPATGFYRQTVFNLGFDCMTSKLTPGSYTVAIYWRSTFDATGMNSLSVNHKPTWRYPRSLWLMEVDTSS